MSDLLDAVEDSDEGDDRERPFVCEYGLVHEVDPQTLAIKAIIPSIDPAHVHDWWIVQMTPWVGKPGYGPVCAPTIGTEVLITGRFGQNFTLFYVSRFNETYTVPGEFDATTRGFKTETAYRALADLFVEIINQQRIH